MSFRLNISADPEFRAELLKLVRENIKPAIEAIVSKLMPDTIAKMIEKYLDAIPLPSNWMNRDKPEAGKSRLQLLFASIEAAVHKRVDAATNDLSKDLYKQFEANIGSRLEIMLGHRIDAKLAETVRALIREELSRAFKP